MNKKNSLKTLLLIVALVISGVRLYAYESKQIAISLGAIYSPLEIGTDYGEVFFRPILRERLIQRLVRQ